MNIKITERAGGGWNLWATESGAPTDSPLYTATGRSEKQILDLLVVILAEKAPPETPQPAENIGKSLALYTVLAALTDWTETAKANHEAMEHVHEKVGEECWRQFAPDDIRDMVNGAARELGISEFPIVREAGRQ